MLAELPTRMAVVRLVDGSLWINSPVALGPEAIREVRELGPVRYLVAPTPLHLWRLQRGHELFPQAELWGPPKIPRSDERFALAGVLGDTAPAAWSSDLEQTIFQGNALVQEVEFFHKRSRTLIVADFIQNYPRDGNGSLRTLLDRAGGVLDGGVPIDIRLTFLNRQLARRCLSKLLAYDFDRLVLAHGACVERDGKNFVRKAFDWLANPRSSGGAPDPSS